MHSNNSSVERSSINRRKPHSVFLITAPSESTPHNYILVQCKALQGEHIHTYTCTRTYTQPHLHTHSFIQPCTHTHMYIYMHSYMHAHTFCNILFNTVQEEQRYWNTYKSNEIAQTRCQAFQHFQKSQARENEDSIRFVYLRYIAS